jgi:hypothetical protein
MTVGYGPVDGPIYTAIGNIDSFENFSNEGIPFEIGFDGDVDRVNPYNPAAFARLHLSIRNDGNSTTVEVSVPSTGAKNSWKEGDAYGADFFACGGRRDDGTLVVRMSYYDPTGVHTAIWLQQEAVAING